MTPENRSHEWLREFESFLKQEDAFPPASVNRAILSQVRADLNPQPKLVAAKLFGLHAMGAGIVSLFCPQLGVGPVMGGHGIMHFFMQYGPVACATICGALFLSLSTVLVTAFLTREELRLANRYGLLSITLLVSISFAGLMLAGGTADRLSYLAWIVGAVGTGWTILKLGAAVRLGAPLHR